MASRTSTDPIEILLEMGVDLDNLSEEEDYLSALMEAVNTLQIKNAGDDRIGPLQQEIRKVRQKRKAADPKFKAKKTKISADSFKKGTATETAPQSIGQKALPSAIKPKTSIIPYQKPDEVDEEEEGGKKKKAKTRKKTNKDQNLLEGIAKSVSNIADILKDQYGLKKKKSSNDAKKAEAEQRKLKESGLEKRFKGLSKVAEKVIAPVKGVLDSILDFFLNIIIGRFLVKFIRWFGDPKNKKKVDSVVRFLTDHGPKLLAAFLLFGTGIGRFTVRLSALLIKGALRLGAAAAKFALGFARRHPAAAAITAIVGGAALAGAMQSKTPSNDPDAPEGRTQLEDTMDYGGVTGDPVAGAFSAGGIVPSYEEGGTVGGFIPNFFGMAKGAGSSVKEKGLGNAAMDFAGNALGGVKNFMDEKGISDVLMAHPLAKLGLLGFDKGKELLGGLTNFLNEKGIGDVLMQHPLAKMGSGFMNFGKDPARDITGESGKDVTGAGVDTQLISARPGDFVVNKKTADAMGPEYFDAISTNTGEKVSGAGPDTQMIAARPGEIVVNRETVNALGPDHFLGLNRFFGGAGANKPKMAKVQAASGGGFVLPAFSTGGYISGTDTGKRGTPDPKKEDKSGGAPPSSDFGYRLGQVNPMQDLRTMQKMDEKVVDKERRRGQGGRLVGSTTQRAGEGTKIYEDGQLVTSYDKYGRKKEYGKPEGFMRTLSGVGDLLTGNLFDFDRRNKKNVGISEKRAVTKEFKGDRDFTDDTTTSRLMTAIARSDLIKHQDQILRQLPKGNTIENVISGDIFRGVGQGGKELGSTTRRGGSNITPEKLARILATSDAQEATRKKQDNARRLDLAIRGIGEKDGVSMTAGDMTPALQQAEATANKRHVELMKSTDQKKIAAYDKQHGEGAYSQKLKEKLYKTYGAGASGQTQPISPKPTGKVVGRENLPSTTQKVLARMDAQRAGGLQPDMKTSGPALGRLAMSAFGGSLLGPAGMMGSALLGGGVENIMGNISNAMTQYGGNVKDGNIGTPTAQEQKDFDKLAASKEKLRVAEAKLGTTNKDIVTPAAPSGGGNNMKVIRVPSPGGGVDNPNDKQTGGSDVDAAAPGNGNKAKWSILGIPMPF